MILILTQEYYLHRIKSALIMVKPKVLVTMHSTNNSAKANNTQAITNMSRIN